MNQDENTDPRHVPSDSESFKKAFLQAIDFLKMDFSGVESVIQDPKMPVWVFVFMGFGGLALALARASFPGLLLTPIQFILNDCFFIFLVWVLAGPVLGGKASFPAQLQTMGLLSVIQWVLIVPIFGKLVYWILLVYALFVVQKLIARIHGLTQEKSWIAVLVPTALFIFSRSYYL